MRTGPRRVALGIVSLALAGSMAGWGEEGPAGSTRAGEPSADRELVLDLDLVDTSGAEVQAVRQGEPVTLRLVLHNRGDAPQRLRFPSACTYDIRIAEPRGREIWRWSQGRMFAQVLTEVVVDAGASREYRVSWGQTTSEGGTAPPGLYEVEGWIPALGAEVRGRPLAFTIQ